MQRPRPVLVLGVRVAAGGDHELDRLRRSRVGAKVQERGAGADPRVRVGAELDQQRERVEEAVRDGDVVRLLALRVHRVDLRTVVHEQLHDLVVAVPYDL